MPLSFNSTSHGSIAFGFFNIESDMLLLDNYFFFADQFCSWLKTMAGERENGLKRFVFDTYVIPDPKDIGDLMGAIHGVRFTGFIGDLYRLFPFPEAVEDFKQNPEGYQTQDIVRSKIKNVSERSTICFDFLKNKQIQIGPYIFHKKVFHELIQYVWKGGYPRWKNEVRPQYVDEMKNCIQKSDKPFFKGVFHDRRFDE